MVLVVVMMVSSPVVWKKLFYSMLKWSFSSLGWAGVCEHLGPPLVLLTSVIVLVPSPQPLPPKAVGYRLSRAVDF